MVLIGRADEKDKAEADFTMRIFNADGSEAMMCGNASRCVGKYLYDNKITTQTQIRLLTLSGVKVLDLHLAPEGVVDSVTVDMNEPILENKKQFISGIGILPDGTFVSMGNPHYVIFVDDIEAVNVAAEGSRLEHHPAFPERCNIEFAEVRPDGIRVRVVSVPSEGLFRQQDAAYQESGVPRGSRICGLTAGLPVNLQAFLVGAAPESRIWGLESFGFSAPYKVLDQKLGFTADNVYNQVKSLLK